MQMNPIIKDPAEPPTAGILMLF